MIGGSGPAFPTSRQCGESGEYWVETTEGMTLRDYVAVKAMQGMLAGGTSEKNFHRVVQSSWELADAMIKERNK